MIWIANKEGCLKPAEEGQVIVTTESPFGGKHSSEAWYCEGQWFEAGHDISDSVIAWMPMPAPADLQGYEDDGK